MYCIVQRPMTIKTAIPSTSISNKELEDILFHYNSMKPIDTGILEILLCREGGFKIISPLKHTPYENHNNHYMNQIAIEQRKDHELRWNQKKYLVGYCNIPTFSQEEEMLLFKTMRFVLGKENVEYYDTYGDAKKESPSILENLLIKRSPKRTLSCSPPTSKLAVFRRILPI